MLIVYLNYARGLFYKYVCGLVFENAKPYLDNAIVKIDRSGGPEFRRELASALKRAANETAAPGRHVKRVETAEAQGNDLLQVADMVCGAVARGVRADKKKASRFRDVIKHRELRVRSLPGQE